jgi:hypothetical protein
VLNTANNLSEEWQGPDRDSYSTGSDQNECHPGPIIVLDLNSFSDIAQTNLTVDEYRTRILANTLEIDSCTPRFEAMVEAARTSHRRSNVAYILEGRDKEEGGGRRDGDEVAGGKSKGPKMRLVAGIFLHDNVHATVLLALVKSELSVRGSVGSGADDKQCGAGGASRKHRIVNSLVCFWYVFPSFSDFLMQKLTRYVSLLARRPP